MSRSNEIETILAAELAAAKKRNSIARENFRSVIKSIPSGLPASDGALRIQIAGDEHRDALEGLYRALTRFNEFVVYGTIPDDLKEPITGSADLRSRSARLRPR